MRQSRAPGFATAFLLALAAAGNSVAIVSGQVDDFEDGSTMTWTDGGSPNPPVNVPDGGPLGEGDGFLLIRGNGTNGPGGRPTTFNGMQWGGNYTAAGVVGISADLKNTGVTQLDMRLLITTLPGGKRFLTAPVIVPPASGWLRATWQVSSATLTPIDSPPGDPVEALTGVTRLWIFHNAQPSFPGPALVAELGIDNIRAEAALPDRDGDGISDAPDDCPFFANPSQQDTDLDGRGDACECTDQNGDGRNTGSDILAINQAIFNPSLATPLCDGNNDGLCNVNDIIAANVEIFSPGNTSTCARQPAPGP